MAVPASGRGLPDRLSGLHCGQDPAGQAGVINKAVYLALGVNMEGHKELLGLWLAENEGAKFWLNVLTELQNRGVRDILIACVDGLKGFPDAINTAYPETRIQLCIVTWFATQ